MFTQLNSDRASRLYILQPSYDPLIEYYAGIVGSYCADPAEHARGVREAPGPADHDSPVVARGPRRWSRWFPRFLRYGSGSDRAREDGERIGS
jgi:hypothetical protein